MSKFLRRTSSPLGECSICRQTVLLMYTVCVFFLLFLLLCVSCMCCIRRYKMCRKKRTWTKTERILSYGGDLCLVMLVIWHHIKLKWDDYGLECVRWWDTVHRYIFAPYTSYATWTLFNTNNCTEKAFKRKSSLWWCWLNQRRPWTLFALFRCLPFRFSPVCVAFSISFMTDMCRCVHI